LFPHDVRAVARKESVEEEALMKRLISTLVGSFLFFTFSVSPAHALRVIVATIFMGEVQVIGIQAKRSADISWEGGVVAHANKGGAFLFSTTNLPIDCVGQLSDGVSTISVVINGCTTHQVVGGGVLKTGQSTCYETNTSGALIPCPGTGQDGELQVGATRSYTADNGNGTIRDNITNLVWEKLTNDGTIHDVDNVYTWDEAFQKIADLNTANFAGHNDWRLPNINELKTLPDYGQFWPSIDPAFNNGVDSFTQPSGDSAAYWSSTTNQFYPWYAWTLYFDIGIDVGYDIKANKNRHVRAVRAGL
jgi:hypothetical protein